MSSAGGEFGRSTQLWSQPRRAKTSPVHIPSALVAVLPPRSHLPTEPPLLPSGLIASSGARRAPWGQHDQHGPEDDEDDQVPEVQYGLVAGEERHGPAGRPAARKPAGSSTAKRSAKPTTKVAASMMGRCRRPSACRSIRASLSSQTDPSSMSFTAGRMPAIEALPRSLSESRSCQRSALTPLINSQSVSGVRR